MGKRQALNFVSVRKQWPLGDACCPEPDREAWCFAIRRGEWGRGAGLCLSLCPSMGAVVVLRSRFCFLCIPVTRSVCVIGDGSPEAHVSWVPAVGPVSGQLWVVSALGRRAWEEQTQRLNCGVMFSVPDPEVSTDTGEGQQSDPEASSWASSGKRPQGWPLRVRWRRWVQRERRGEEEGQHSPG